MNLSWGPMTQTQWFSRRPHRTQKSNVLYFSLCKLVCSFRVKESLPYKGILNTLSVIGAYTQAVGGFQIKDFRMFSVLFFFCESMNMWVSEWLNRSTGRRHQAEASQWSHVDFVFYSQQWFVRTHLGCVLSCFSFKF